MRLPVLAIVEFALYVTVCELITCNLPKWSQIESLTFEKVGHGHELQHRRISCRIASLWPTKWLKNDGLSLTVLMSSTSEAFRRTQIHTRRRTHSGDSNRQECSALHFAYKLQFDDTCIKHECEWRHTLHECEWRHTLHECE